MDRVFQDEASLLKTSHEHINVYGPIEIENKEYFVAFYYPNFKYWKFNLMNLPLYLLTPIIPSLYLKARTLGDIVEGFSVMDSKARTIPFDARLYTRIFKTTIVWLNIYLTPFYPPRLFELFDTYINYVSKIVDVSRNCVYPNPKTLIEEGYIKQLKIADQQNIKLFDIFKKINKLVQNIGGNFRTVSEKPSERSSIHLKEQAERLQDIQIEMANWCEERARSWPNFVDFSAAYRVAQQERRSPLKKYGPHAFYNGLLGIIVYLLSGGSIPLSMAYSIVADIGIQYFRDLFLRPKWQAKDFLKVAKKYRGHEQPVKRFLDLYDKQLDLKTLARPLSLGGKV